MFYHSSSLSTGAGALLLALCFLVGCGEKDRIGVEKTQADEPAQRESTVAQWPIFRGDSRLQGRSPGDATQMPSTAWRVQLEQDILTTPVIAKGSIYVACDDGLLYCLEADTGKERWRFDNGFGFEASPFFSDDKIYIGSLDGLFYCLDAATGEHQWLFKREAQISGSANKLIAKSLEGGDLPLIVFGSYDSRLYALNASTGEQLWDYQADNYINGSPAITVNGEILFGGCDSYAHVVDAQTGASIRRVFLNTYIPASIALEGGYGYAGNYDGQMIAFSVDTGEPLWTFEDSEAPFSTALAVGERHIYGASEDRSLYAVDKATGKLAWRYKAGRPLEASPLIIGETVIATDAGGVLHALNIADGSVRWTYDLGARTTAAPAVANDRIYIGDKNGMLHALSLTGEGGQPSLPMPDEDDNQESPFVDFNGE